MTIKVLFVCHGNICRSPMAEFIFKKEISDLGLTDRFEVSSAATSSEEIQNGYGNPIYPPALEQLRLHGIPCSGHRAVQITRDDYRRYDYLIYMDQMNLRNMMRILGGDPQGKCLRLMDLRRVRSLVHRRFCQDLCRSGVRLLIPGAAPDPEA